MTRVLLALLAALLLFALAFFVWPTPWEVRMVRYDDRIEYPVRVNRFTGEVRALENGR